MTNKTAVVYRHLAFEDLGIWQRVLQENGFSARYVDIGVDEISVDEARDSDLLIILGGPIGVDEESHYPLLRQEKQALAARLALRLPTLGVCLGAQLIAEVLGASISRLPKKEIGYAPIELTAQGEDSVLAPLQDVPVLHWHGDQFGTPEQAERLAQTQLCPNQAFQVGAEILALQFHLEADPNRIEQWLIGHAGELAGEGINPRDIAHDAHTVGRALTVAGEQVLQNWLSRLG